MKNFIFGFLTCIVVLILVSIIFKLQLKSPGEIVGSNSQSGSADKSFSSTPSTETVKVHPKPPKRIDSLMAGNDTCTRHINEITRLFPDTNISVRVYLHRAGFSFSRTSLDALMNRFVTNGTQTVFTDGVTFYPELDLVDPLHPATSEFYIRSMIAAPYINVKSAEPKNPDHKFVWMDETKVSHSEFQSNDVPPCPNNCVLTSSLPPN